MWKNISETDVRFHFKCTSNNPYRHNQLLHTIRSHAMKMRKMQLQVNFVAQDILAQWTANHWLHGMLGHHMELHAVGIFTAIVAIWTLLNLKNNQKIIIIIMNLSKELFFALQNSTKIICFTKGFAKLFTNNIQRLNLLNQKKMQIFFFWFGFVLSPLSTKWPPKHTQKKCKSTMLYAIRLSFPSHAILLAENTIGPNF